MAKREPNELEPKESRDDLVFKALAGRDRRKMLDLLREQPLTTGALCQDLPHLNRCTVMQHLGVLEEAGLVVSRKRGRERWNYLDVDPIQRLYRRWISDYASPTAGFLSRLKKDLEAA